MFYVETLSGNAIRLTPEESRHCIRVLRMREGDTIRICDGKGGVADAVITEASQDATLLKIDAEPVIHSFPGIKLNLAVAVTRHSDRFEWMLEKVTEAGVHTITPVFCSRSETRGRIKRSRWEKIIMSAMKQSLRYHLPVLNDPIEFPEFLKMHPGGLIAWCGDQNLPHLRDRINLKTDAVNLLIGPEGDFTPDEFKSANDAGYTGISLGRYRLRTETAAIAACIMIKLAYE